jgi:hypothetical protein
MKALLRAALALYLALTAHGAIAAAIDQWSVVTNAEGTALTLSGMWKDTCSPGNAMVTIAGRSIDVLLPAPPPDEFCAFFIVPWRLTIPLGVLAPGDYTVTVRSTGFLTTTTLAVFPITVTGSPVTATASVVPALEPAGLATAALMLLVTGLMFRRKSGDRR